MSEGARLEAHAEMMAQHGVLADAALAYDNAASAYIEEDRREDAFRMLHSLAVIDQLVGENALALDAIERALAMPSWPEDRVKALMTKASVLDALGDPRAVVAWTHVLSHTAEDDTKLVATAHMIGALVGHGDFATIQQLRSKLDAEQTMTHELRIAYIGGAGQSAGKHGTSLLAQAVLLLHEHPSAWTFATSAIWELLVGQVAGAGDPQLAVDLCGLGSRLTLRNRMVKQHGLLAARVELTIKRVAAARSMTLDALLAEIERDPDDIRMLTALRALVPEGHWVLATN